MNRTKLKKAPAGQRNISVFFSCQNHKEGLSSSTKLSITGGALAKCETQSEDGVTSAIRPHSPLKKSIVLDLENLLPSSPEFLLSVPETPKSQIKVASSSSRYRGQSISQPSQRFGQLSPVCRGPRPKGQSVRRAISKGSGKGMSEVGCSSSIKRLISPSQESNNAKKKRPANPLAEPDVFTGSNLKATRPLIGCLNTPLFSGDQSVDCCRDNEVVLEDNKSIMPSVESAWMEDETEKDCGLALIGTEQKATDPKDCQIAHTHLDEITRTPTALRHTNTAQNITSVMQVRDDGELGEVEATRTASTSVKEDNGTLSGLKQAEGATAASPEEERLMESWFAEEMDDGGQVSEKKSRKSREVPDHVILTGGRNNRYWVLDVEERPGCKTLKISCFKSLHPTETCVLIDGWEDTPVRRGDVVHLEGEGDGGSWLVDREHGFLVLRPDSLISGTSISSSIRCMRQAVLGDMFKSTDGGSKEMLKGSMVHEIFQNAATAKDFSMKTLSDLADQSLCSPQYLGDMYSLGVSQEEMKEELYQYLPSIERWAEEYLSSPTPKAICLKMPDSGAPSRGQESETLVTIAELADIEESVWAPRFGLKGRIDVTAQIRTQRPRSGRHTAPEDRTVPLELKTGKESNSIEHRSQVILYTLMTEDRYNPGAGFLLYLKTGNLHPVVPTHMDRRELLKLRNTLVRHIHHCVETEAGRSHLARLPDVLTDRQTCQYCSQRRNCALYERAIDSNSENVSKHSVRDFLQQETGHLTPRHIKYFSHWLLLCCLEAVTMESKNGQKRVWLEAAEERQKNGNCVADVQLCGPVTAQSAEAFLHRFQRSSAAPQKGLDESGLARGDPIVVSDIAGRLVGLATGYLHDVSKTSIGCTLNRDLSKHSGVLFRLDGDEGVVGVSSHLRNLSNLMENSPESDRLRQLVVDLRPPEFISNLSTVLPREAKDDVADILKGLNKPQKQAMKKVLLSIDYTLVVGMPGTGKTTTICALVRILHACGFSVLLTSYTHSAVDNILLKLKRFRVGFLRLGRGQKVHPDILPYTEETRKKGVHSLSELEHLYNKELVVATTCMGMRHPIFTRRRFDFCIVDEASQISQPVSIGPLLYAKRFVLVGDHQQLPPIVQNPEARSLGMDESLFKRLEHHDEAVVQLNVQYRMNRQIMSLSNSLMYEGRLECGSERTATALLNLPFLPTVQSELSSFAEADPLHDLAWIQTTLLPSNPVCFLDCSMVPALESLEQSGISNHTEAVIIHKLLSLLIKAGCKPGDIGVITPYRQQLKSISALLQSSVFTGVEVKTVDKYQGRDKSLIVLSFVRSNPEGEKLGELLKDWRRLNVAITRAKHKLVMVGSATTLRHYAPVEKLLKHLQQENMIIQLPQAAHKAIPIYSL
ncbi:DNA replication ATP-dependent helicase/nuclease DNA2-like [Brachionichthys hirsutus]|uniref:DNA replication ATP-dependent helicase/nuclease DNA2-like n=1 Tax=Brachionichthys hirsutus TaxID=412623 RepID=UPI003605356E